MTSSANTQEKLQGLLAPGTHHTPSDLDLDLELQLSEYQHFLGLVIYWLFSS